MSEIGALKKARTRHQASQRRLYEITGCIKIWKKNKKKQKQNIKFPSNRYRQTRFKLKPVLADLGCQLDTLMKRETHLRNLLDEFGLTDIPWVVNREGELSPDILCLLIMKPRPAF